MIAFSLQAQRENEIAFRLGNLRDLARRGLVDPELGTLTVQSRLLAESCINLTPFRSLGQARTAITRDATRIFRPLDPAQFRDQRMQQLVRRGDAAAWDAFARNTTGPLKGTKAVIPTPQLHKQALGNRGRVRRNATNYVTLWKNRAALKETINSARERAGWARAGWLRAYIPLGGTRAPQWVTRHFGAAPGTFTDGRMSTDVPFVAAGNATRYFRQRDDNNGASIVSAALRGRASAMRNYYDTIMRMVSEGKMTPFQTQQAQIAAQFDAAA